MALGAAALLLGGTGCTQGSQARNHGGEYPDHHPELSAAVKQALANDDRFQYPGVNVTATKSVIQLNGFATTQKQKDRAGKLSMAVPGVKAVVNRLKVRK